MRRPSMRTWAMMLVIVSIGWSVAAQQPHPTVLYFHQEGCPECETIREVLDEMQQEHPELTVGSYEITQPGNLDLLEDLAARFGVYMLSVPIVFVGQDTIVVGAELGDRLDLRAAIDACATKECPSLLDTPSSERLRTDLWILAAMTALFSLLYLFQGN